MLHFKLDHYLFIRLCIWRYTLSIIIIIIIIIIILISYY